MYLGNSDELRQRIKEYNAGPSGNFIFNRRDLEPIGKTFRGTTPRSRDYEYVRDFAIVDTKPPKEDDTNWTDLKEEIKKIIQKRSQPGDNLWNNTPRFIYFYLGLRTLLDNDTWILVKRSHLYLAAKNGSNLTQPALRFTEQTPIKILNLWDLKKELGIGGKLYEDIWEKIQQAEKELIEAEQKKKKEERGKLSALWTQVSREVNEIFRGYEWEDLEFDSDYLELFFTDKCSCETPGEDWHQHMLNCMGRKFSEVEEFAKKLKEAMQKAVDKFTQLKEASIQKIEAELVAKGLSETEVFDSEFYSASPNWGWDWRAKIRSIKHKFILEFREKDLTSYIELKNKLKNIRNNTPPPTGEPRNENLNGNQNGDQGSENWEDWWEKQKKEWGQAEQTHQQKAEERKKKRKEKREKQKEKEQQEEENWKSKWAEFDQRQKQQGQSEENNNDNSEFRPKTTEIPSFLLPEELEEISTDKSPSPSNENNNFPNSPKNQPTLPKPEKKESREDLINKLKAEIETLKNISNKSPSQEKELKQKESYLRWLEDSNSSSNSDQDFTKTTTKSSLGNSLFLMVGLGIITVGILLFLFIISKKKRKNY